MFTVTITFIDSHGRTTRKRFDSIRSTINDVVNDISDLVQDFLGVTNLGIVGASIDYRVANIDEDPQANSNIDVGATLHCLLEDSAGYAFKIPGIKDSLVSNGQVLINNTAITQLMSNFTSSGYWRVSDGEAISVVKYGVLDK